MNFFQRRKILKNANFLELHPVRVHEHEEMGDGKIYLKVPKFSKKWLRDFAIPANKKKYYTIYLDEIGTATWLEIDGEKNVKQICDKLVKKMGEKVEPYNEVEERVAKFLAQLYEQRYITFRELQKENYSNIN
ncbi:MAG: PqqD family protein [Bacteroidales bacterium]